MPNPGDRLGRREVRPDGRDPSFRGEGRRDTRGALDAPAATSPSPAPMDPARCTLTRQARSKSKSRARRKRSKKASVSGCGVCGTPASSARRLSSLKPGCTSGELSGSALSCGPATGPDRISAMPAAPPPLPGRRGGKAWAQRHPPPLAVAAAPRTLTQAALDSLTPPGQGTGHSLKGTHVVPSGADRVLRAFYSSPSQSQLRKVLVLKVKKLLGMFMSRLPEDFSHPFHFAFPL